ncbi:ERF family protein [Bilophila wadsworthia]|uniref:ERF family protein n=1 Tax=Bilophila wadsworthia TaxID=35833 RepID=UPI0024308566|nr:ERF family protein [Bilophila wadsworthia]
MPEYTSQEVGELAKALINVQRQLQPALKDANNPFTKSKYATLNSVMDSCREALLSNGIWLCQYPVPADPGCLGLVTKLTHAESGQWQASLAVVPLPKADPQGVGISMTYMRRYALSAMLGIVTEEDTDGEVIQNRSKTVIPQKTPIKRPQIKKDETQADSDSSALNRTSEGLLKLPDLEGITYQVVPAQNGQQCIVARGDTVPQKDSLTAAGFKWNPQRKIWWKYAA